MDRGIANSFLFIHPRRRFPITADGVKSSIGEIGRIQLKHKFHNLEFSHRQQGQIVEYAEGRDWTSSDVLQTCVESHLKVSFSWDGYHDTCLLSITPKVKEHPFYGYIVSVRHTDIHTLLKVVMWLSAEGFSSLEPPASQNGRFDW